MNKAVPHIIGGTELHPLAKQRTQDLLTTLEKEIPGITKTKSSSDRLRLLATFIFQNNADRFVTGSQNANV